MGTSNIFVSQEYGDKKLVQQHRPLSYFVSWGFLSSYKIAWANVLKQKVNSQRINDIL